MKTASEKLLIVAKTIEAIRKGAQVEWPEGIEDEIREIAKQINDEVN
jgi:cell division protein ZapA (FtsZ GTPase activity inhibitor)